MTTTRTLEDVKVDWLAAIAMPKTPERQDWFDALEAEFKVLDRAAAALVPATQVQCDMCHTAWVDPVRRGFALCSRCLTPSKAAIAQSIENARNKSW